MYFIFQVNGWSLVRGTLAWWVNVMFSQHVVTQFSPNLGTSVHVLTATALLQGQTETVWPKQPLCTA